MTDSPEILPAVELTPDEVASFSTQIQDGIRVGEEFLGKRQRWILIGVASKQDAELIRATAIMVRRIAGQRRKRLTERNVEELVDLYLQGEERANVDLELEQDNAELRSQYLREVPTYSASDIRKLLYGSELSNPSEPASR
ncbi:MAG: hypothetical protein OXI81_02040 [Paracoccaceae bacterium]|nr:hypothetical protein [Paracoccaceae bacterium]